ncbi:MAG: hypothetical protein AMXMBFR64_41760 [Myxococcales bacterium]
MSGPEGALVPDKAKVPAPSGPQEQEAPGAADRLKQSVRGMGYADGAAALAPAPATFDDAPDGQVSKDAGGALSCPVPTVTTGAATPLGTLVNRRFVGDPVLEKVAKGKATLQKGSKGPAVSKLQAALESLAIPMPKPSLDNDFGKNTKGAVEVFQTTESIAGAKAGVLDQATLSRLDVKTPHADADVHVWREAESEDLAGTQVTHKALSNPRFKGDPVLEMVASGMGAITAGKVGGYVWKIQRSLKDLGFKAGTDGTYSKETKAAVATFQEAFNVPLGPKAGQQTMTEPKEEKGSVNGSTMAALDAYSPTNVPTETVPEGLTPIGGPNYAKLFEDGRFDATVALGYDEGGAHVAKLGTTVSVLKDELGMAMVDPRTAKPDEIAAAGLKDATLDREIVYFTKKFHSTAVNKDVQVVLKLIAARSDGSNGAERMEKFKGAMASDDYVGYTGHARAGTGPDFDDKHDSAGNYVMGKGYNAEYNKAVAGAPNQLEATDFKDKAQVIQFWGCTTDHYQKHLDAKMGKRGTKGSVQDSKDIVTTTKPVFTARGVYGMLAMVRGLLAEADGATLKDMMDISQRDKVTTMKGFKS